MNPIDTTATTTITSFRLLYATQSGRAKACARRVERALRTSNTAPLSLAAPTVSLDEAIGDQQPLADVVSTWKKNSLLILFISTTGDGEPPDSMTRTWRQLLQRSLSPTLLQHVTFMVFNLGDRAYGPQFCAAGRKLTIRLLQLGATLWGEPGYGDDGTPGGGVLRDLDDWIATQLQPTLQAKGLCTTNNDNNHDNDDSLLQLVIPYQVTIDSNPSHSDDDSCHNNIENNHDLSHLNDFFRHLGPLTAYQYNHQTSQDGLTTTWQQTTDNETTSRTLPLQATVTTNQRLTADDWEQDTRHVRLVLDDHVDSSSNVYRAGDVVAIIPVNASTAVNRFLSLLPASVQAQADTWMDLQYTTDLNNHSTTSSLCVGVAYPHWPRRITLRQWLTYCADFQTLPEREDLWALSHYCDVQHERGLDQRDKLQSLSDTSASALYTDYILRQKRSWADVLYDFDSLQTASSPLTLEALISLLAPLRPREYSIASAPTVEIVQKGILAVDLTVAVVEGTTPLGRRYHGLCSKYLASQCAVGDTVRLWIRPGSFAALPRSNHEIPVLCMGAGTGIAPLRGLLQERAAHAHHNKDRQALETNATMATPCWTTPDALLFGCRKESTDFYYKDEWEVLVQQGSLTLLTAFSRDQWHKFYVQQRLRQDDPQGLKLLHHLVTRQGHVYLAGGAKMARSLKEEMVELLDPHLGGKATQFLAQLQRAGRFRVEAWS